MRQLANAAALFVFMCVMIPRPDFPPDLFMNGFRQFIDPLADAVLETLVDESADEQDIEAAVHPEKQDGKGPEAPVKGRILIHAIHIHRKEHRENHPDRRSKNRAGQLLYEPSLPSRHMRVQNGKDHSCQQKTQNSSCPRKCQDCQSLIRKIFRNICLDFTTENKVNQHHKDRCEDEGLHE
jgi:hypothetical protein